MENNVVEAPQGTITQAGSNAAPMSVSAALPKGPVSEVPILIRVADGAQIKATWFAGKDARASLIFFPAMGVEAAFYHRFCNSIAAAGFNVLPVDLRGHGQHSVKAGRNNRFGFKEMLECDWAAAVKTAKGLAPELPVILGGHSLGGQLCALYASMQPQMVKGLLLIATPSVYFRGWRFPANLKILGLTQLAWGISEVVGYFPGDLLGFAGRESAGVMRDWARNARTGGYQPERMTQDFATQLSRLNCPVLSASFTDDEFCPDRAAINLLQKLPNAQVTHLHLSPESLGVESVGHFAWAKQREKLLESIIPWLDARTQKLQVNTDSAIGKSGGKSGFKPETASA